MIILDSEEYINKLKISDLTEEQLEIQKKLYDSDDWVEYKNTLYRVGSLWTCKSDYGEDYNYDVMGTTSLDLVGFGKWKEVNRGFSGILTFGAHGGSLEIKDAIEILEGYTDVWSEEKIADRIKHRDSECRFVYNRIRYRWIRKI